MVAPLAGAWIETDKMRTVGADADVAPLAGAWIETLICPVAPAIGERRAPRGRVD